MDELGATLTGHVALPAVHFTKHYHPAPGVHQSPIHYDGSCERDATHITGTWRIGTPGGSMNGVFEMRRVTGRTVEARLEKAGADG